MKSFSWKTPWRARKTPSKPSCGEPTEALIAAWREARENPVERTVQLRADWAGAQAAIVYTGGLSVFAEQDAEVRIISLVACNSAYVEAIVRSGVIALALQSLDPRTEPADILQVLSIQPCDWPRIRSAISQYAQIMPIQEEPSE